jgi:catechol 2,3-dioxygenase-like lactoylglutathione lyase family enzyme
MGTKGFTHVSVHAHDLEESARFYGALFDMEEYSRWISLPRCAG